MKNLKIYYRILIGFVAVTMMTVAMTLIAVISLNRLTADYTEAINVNGKPLNSAGHALEAAHAIRAELRLYIAYVGVGNRENDVLDEQEKEIRVWVDNFEKYSAEFGGSIANDNVREKFDQAMDVYEKRFKVGMNKIIDGAKAGKNMEVLMEIMLNETRPAMVIITEDLFYCMDYKNYMLEQYTVTVKENTDSILFALVSLTLVSIIVSIVLSTSIAGSIIKPITQLSAFMSKVSDGNFSERMHSESGSEIGRLINSCNSLVIYNDMSVTNIKEASEKIRIAASELLSISSDMIDNSNMLSMQTSSVSASNQEFASSMSVSAASLATTSEHISTTASSIEEMNSSVRSIASVAEEAREKVTETSVLADDIQESIAKSSESVADISNKFNKIAQSINEINLFISKMSDGCAVAVSEMANADIKASNTNIIIKRLEEMSRQIGKITGFVKDIADQTNMLAINAAIEAAGAGEFGKGFMVVANEVKELSKQTAEATVEIVEQIGNMQRSMPEAVGAVSEITAFIGNISEFISNITSEIGMSGERCEIIASDSSDAVMKINLIKTEINKISENAVSVNEAASASAKKAKEIAAATSELTCGANNITVNSESASSNISEISTVITQMVRGIESLAGNTQSINEEAYAIQCIAESVKKSSEELLQTANAMEGLISKFKVS